MRKISAIKKFTLSALFFIGAGTLFAQHVELAVDHDTITLNQTAQVSITIDFDGSCTSPGLPPQAGYAAIGQSQITESSGGKTTSTVITTIQPQQTGTFKIGPVYVQCGSNRYFSNEKSITIVQGDEAVGDKEAPFVFMRCEVPEKKFVVGEEIPLTIRIYKRIRLSSIDVEHPVAKYFNNFLYIPGPYPVTEDLPDTVISYKGFKYTGVIIYREFVYPNTSGKLMVPSYEFSCMYKMVPFPTGDDILDEFAGIDRAVKLVSPPIPIDVLPVPDKNKPSDYAGDVGDFSLNASIDKTEAKTGEAVKLTVNIRGKGNISFVQLPAITFPDGITAYSPVASDSVTNLSSGISGEKTFVITLIPDKAGDYTLPEVHFSYYNASKKEYVTLTTPEFPLKVTQAPPTKDNAENNLPDGFLSAKGPMEAVGKFLLRILPALLAFFALIWWKKRRDEKKRLAEEAQLQAEEKPAPQKSNVSFLEHNAVQLMQQNNLRGAVYVSYEALITACCEKGELGREEASMSQVRYRLGTKKMDEASINEIVELLEKLSEMRYAPGNLNQESAYLLVTAMQNALRKLGF